VIPRTPIVVVFGRVGRVARKSGRVGQNSGSGENVCFQYLAWRFGRLGRVGRQIPAHAYARGVRGKGMNDKCLMCVGQNFPPYPP